MTTILCLSDNIYMYEGQDYSKISSEADKKAFDELLVLEDEIAGATLEQRVLRRENKVCMDVSPLRVGVSFLRVDVFSLRVGVSSLGVDVSLVGLVSLCG